VRQRLVDFSDSRLTRVRFRVPAIHCIACVWLLENLFRLHPEIGHSQVNFPKRELAIAFGTDGIKLSEVIHLLAALGYEPDLRLSDIGARPGTSSNRRLWLQLGIAGFAFGNSMLFSIASYFGLDSATAPAFQRLVGPISFVLALPVTFYSAADYWRSAWRSLRQRLLNIDVPIAAGIAALFCQSSYEVFSGNGVGYFDSLAALLFFLLCGRLFQQKTFERLAFDRDYRSFFPLRVTRIGTNRDEAVAVSELNVGDRLRIRNGELVPADACLIAGSGLIDYSFVTGESVPVPKASGDYLYAGGRQVGGAIEVETVKPVSQGYLTYLWGQEAFRKNDSDTSLQTLTNRYSQRFTKLVLGIALAAAAYWLWVSPAVALKAFTSVLIVACPCALALAAPFALGAAQRLLARRGVFLKNSTVLERLAAANTIVFDKTGTLTVGSGLAFFHGSPLTAQEAQNVLALARHSAHPLAVRLVQSLGERGGDLAVDKFQEVPGRGIDGRTEGRQVRLGSASWFQELGISIPQSRSADKLETGLLRANSRFSDSQNNEVHVAVDGEYRGWFELVSGLRPNTDALLKALGLDYDLALVSGDTSQDRTRFAELFGSNATVHFQQSPLDKLEFVRSRQRLGRTVVMVGDGLNDAGALKQSDVGVAVVESLSAFSPASDVILTAGMVPQLVHIAAYAKDAVRVVRGCFLISTLYNVIGITIAARGWLAPVVCAVLMPLSSVTVVAFACGLTAWLGRRRLPAVARWEAAIGEMRQPS
jgi:Cu+-exporting ATPase